MTKTFLDRCIDKRSIKQDVVSKETLRSQLERVNALAQNWADRLAKHESPPRRMRTASDCSGYGSDLIAYRLLGLTSRIHPVMMSETDPVKLVLYEAVAKACGVKLHHAVAVSDMSLRKPNDRQSADVYTAGYPCPSYSNLGKRGGVMDKRGLLTLKGLEYIASRRPRIVVLEQVAAILNKTHEKVWGFVRKTLTTLNYTFTFKGLNTKHFGCPQSRSRLYLLAVAKECCESSLDMPEETDPVDLHHFLKKNTVGNEVLKLPKYEKILGPKMWTQGYVLDIGSSERFQSVIRNASPCLTKTRLKQRGYYIPKLKRRLLPEEAARLQGVPQQVYEAMAKVAKEKKLAANALEGSLGDAMSIPVLTAVLYTGLKAAGYSVPTWSSATRADGAQAGFHMDEVFQETG